ncbi:hypothetical protein E2562_033513 [Oryza meyeriana var. granulata]|uniref:Uncharacterized protein n=1 Tax=Oryza meyeriana var. granulata TaxID=110450 RepID=A0A6G1EEK8_9ORYZ|nr:hypothetical protein E2562_033513 [Oryza meyeriana var. granulata]
MYNMHIFVNMFVFDGMHAVTGAYADPIFVEKLGADPVGLARSMPTSGALDRVANKLNVPFFEGTGSAGATIRVYNEQFESDASKHDLDAQIALRPLIEYEFQIWHHNDIGHESGDSNEEMNVNEEAPCVSRRGAGYVDHGDGHGSILMLDSSTEGEESLRGNIHRYHVGASGANRWKSFEEVERPWWLIIAATSCVTDERSQTIDILPLSPIQILDLTVGTISNPLHGAASTSLSSPRRRRYPISLPLPLHLPPPTAPPATAAPLLDLPPPPAPPAYPRPSAAAISGTVNTTTSTSPSPDLSSAVSRWPDPVLPSQAIRSSPELGGAVE